MRDDGGASQGATLPGPLEIASTPSVLLWGGYTKVYTLPGGSVAPWSVRGCGRSERDKARRLVLYWGCVFVLFCSYGLPTPGDGQAVEG